MKNNKLFLSSALVFLVTGFTFQISGMEKRDEENNAHFLNPLTSIDKALGAREYYKRYIVPQGSDNSGVRYWSNMRADQSETEAEYMLANIFFFGRGVVPDYDRAKYWAEKSAMKDNEDAQYLLGLIYYKGGYGVEKDLKLAEHWFLKLAKLNNSLAKEKCKEIELERPTPHKEAEPLHTNKSFVPLFKEMNQTTTQKDPETLCKTGNDYYYGLGVPRDFEKARINYEESAAQNNPNAQFMLGAMNFYGISVPRDEKKAIVYYQRAAAQNHPFAQDNIEVINDIVKFRSLKAHG